MGLPKLPEAVAANGVSPPLLQSQCRGSGAGHKSAVKNSISANRSEFSPDGHMHGGFCESTH
jgi:hypothetical protein